MGVFKMPSLGADMDAGTLAEWLVKPGDAISRGDVIAVVETQKGAIEIEVFETGTVESLDAKIGQKVPVGLPIAVILSAGEQPHEAAVVPEAAQPPEPAQPPKAAPVATPEPAPKPASAPAAPGIAASPAARRWAQELGVDLARLTGSGPQGVVVLADVESARKADASPSPKASPKAAAALAMRRAIAATMTRSKQEIPHFYLSQIIDIQTLSDWLKSENASRLPADRLLLGVVLLKAAAMAAALVQPVNGHYLDGAFMPAKAVNLGVIIALRGGGVVAPAIANADKLPLAQLMRATVDLVARARGSRLRSSELTSGTLTVSSLGDKGADTMTGIIFPPQVAILGIGAPQIRPWVVGSEIVPRQVVSITLSADHRALDGRQATRFLTELDTLLQNPEGL